MQSQKIYAWCNLRLKQCDTVGLKMLLGSVRSWGSHCFHSSVVRMDRHGSCLCFVDQWLKPCSICAPPKYFCFKTNCWAWGKRAGHVDTCVQSQHWRGWSQGIARSGVAWTMRLSQIAKPKLQQQWRLVPEELNTQVHISAYIMCCLIHRNKRNRHPSLG